MSTAERLRQWDERAVAAYVLLVLTRHRVIDKAEARRAAELLHLSVDDVSRAAQRNTDTPRLDSTWSQPATAPAGRVPTGKARTGVQRFPNRRDGEHGPERLCTRCDVWLPANEEHFGIKSRDPICLRSWCRPCWNDYQRERYLTRAQEEAMDAAGVTFTLDEDRPLLACAKCGRPLRAGDEVEGRTTLSHTACGGES